MKGNPPRFESARASLRLYEEPRLHAVPEVAFADGTTSASWEDYHAVLSARFPHLYDGDERAFPTDEAGRLLPRMALRIEREPQMRTVPFIVFPDGSVSQCWEVWHREAAKQRPELYENGGPK